MKRYRGDSLPTLMMYELLVIKNCRAEREIVISAHNSQRAAERYWRRMNKHMFMPGKAHIVFPMGGKVLLGRIVSKEHRRFLAEKKRLGDEE